MKLYRGDSIFNGKTKPYLYRFDGLTTKALGQGDPAYIKKNGLSECITKHVKPNSKTDLSYYNTTDLISFTTDINRAFYWLTDGNKIKIEECPQYQETRYLFEFTIPDAELVEIEEAVFSFKYECNMELKTGNIHNSVLSALRLECPFCDSEFKHEIILIDSAEYLEHRSCEERYAGAKILSQTDKEWLILPFDPLDKTSIKSARIPRANFWKVRHFKGLHEERPLLDNLINIHK